MIGLIIKVMILIAVIMVITGLLAPGALVSWLLGGLQWIAQGMGMITGAMAGGG